VSPAHRDLWPNSNEDHAVAVFTSRRHAHQREHRTPHQRTQPPTSPGRYSGRSSVPPTPQPVTTQLAQDRRACYAGTILPGQRAHMRASARPRLQVITTHLGLPAKTRLTSAFDNDIPTLQGLLAKGQATSCSRLSRHICGACGLAPGTVVASAARPSRAAGPPCAYGCQVRAWRPA
jgi:hypothetical protein